MCLLLSLPGFSRGELISKVVGRVGDVAVTSREVQIAYLLERAMYYKDQASLSKTPRLQDARFAKEVTALTLEWAVYLEAQNFAVSRVTTKELQDARSVVRFRLQGKSQWDQLRVDATELDMFLQRKLTANKFIRSKSESSKVLVTESEAQEYFKRNQSRFGNLPFENFQDKIKVFLAKEQTDARLRDWFLVLQQKYRVQNLMED